MDDSPRYASLHDYVRVIRRRWLLVALVAAGCAALALAASLTSQSTYEASAQVSFRDVTSDLDVIGGGSNVPDASANQIAAANAELITRRSVTKQVSEELADSGLSSTELQNSVSARVGTLTNLVILTARASEAQLAADIANAYAEAAQEVGTQEARSRLADFESSTERELKEAQKQNADSLRLNGLQDRLSRIRTLRQIAQPVEIAASAVVPSSPVSPRPARDLILGLLLGLTLGLMAAFLRDALDRRLHVARDAQQELGMPVLGRVGEGALGAAGLVMNGNMPLGEAEFEAFRILRTNLRVLGTGADLGTVLVTSGLPEEGKSSVSMSLASACRIAGQDVLLIECDLRRPSFARRLAIQPGPGLTDYLLGQASPQDILQIVGLVEPGSWSSADGGQTPSAGSLVCISAGSAVPRAAELLVSERFRSFLSKVRKAYDLVIIDGSPLLSVVDPLEIVAQVDAVLVCARAGQTTRDEARAARAALAHMPERPMGAVLTGLRRSGADAYGYYYGY
jgi:receptor protein-tyrosine kinase